jgi:hypothetical protein
MSHSSQTSVRQPSKRRARVVGVAVIVAIGGAAWWAHDSSTGLSEELAGAESAFADTIEGEPGSKSRLRCRLRRARRKSIWDPRPAWLTAVALGFLATPADCRLDGEGSSVSDEAACLLRRGCFARASELYGAHLPDDAARYVTGVLGRLAESSTIRCRRGGARRGGAGS